MNCDECSELLCDAVDARLSAAQETALRDHCSGCDDCRDLLRDLLDIRRMAATLEQRPAPPEVWDRILGKVESRLAAWVPVAAAAALVVTLGGASWFYFVASHTRPSGTPASDVELARNAESELQQAEQHYESAIAALEQLTANRQSSLDPQVADAIRQSLATIDKAIGDSRAALKAQPDSIVAQTSLLEALRMKVALLQETVSLLNARS
jgi:hypothetical protein